MRSWVAAAAAAWAILGCGGAPEIASFEDPIEDLGPLAAKGDELRVIALELAPGDIKRYRVTAPAFQATLSQQGDALAQLSAKHYEYDIFGEADVHPTVVAIADGTVRRWTLRVHNLSEEPLVADIVVESVDEPATEEPGTDGPGTDGPAVELGIISDIDKTVLPKHDYDTDELPAPYPGVVTLYGLLEHGAEGQGAPGDLYFVTARSEDRIVDLPAWMEEHGFPEGPIEPGVYGVPWLAQAEKVADISAIMDATGAQQFVLFGDSSHRDPEAYREIRSLYPERVLSIVIHRVNNPNPDRVEGMHLVDNYAQAAAALFSDGVLDEGTARAVMQDALDGGLDITQAEIEALIESAR